MKAEPVSISDSPKGP